MLIILPYNPPWIPWVLRCACWKQQTFSQLGHSLGSAFWWICGSHRHHQECTSKCCFCRTEQKNKKLFILSFFKTRDKFYFTLKWKTRQMPWMGQGLIPTVRFTKLIVAFLWILIRCHPKVSNNVWFNHFTVSKLISHANMGIINSHMKQSRLSCSDIT